MPLVRNPFVRKPPTATNGTATDDPLSPNKSNGYTNGHVKPPHSRSDSKPSLLGSRAASQTPSQTDDIKLSVVDDTGAYLPPSPLEKKTFWSRTPTSTTTSSHLSGEIEPFSISRESFESYRRSFDISARSPVIHPDTHQPRTSLDSRSPYSPRSNSGSYLNNLSAHRRNGSLAADAVKEEPFEDVGLEEAKTKKKSIFSRFTNDDANTSEDRPTSSGATHSTHGLGKFLGRKRGQSGQGAELRALDEKDKEKDKDRAKTNELERQFAKAQIDTSKTSARDVSKNGIVTAQEVAQDVVAQPGDGEAKAVKAEGGN